MAVRKSLLGGYTYQDMFDTQDALDAGTLSSAVTGTFDVKTAGKGFLGLATDTNTYNQSANKNTLGSQLGQTESILGYKKRKLEQEQARNRGSNTQQSILGGGAF
jgi:hypothetical protein